MIARSLILAGCVAVLLPGLPRAQEAPRPQVDPRLGTGALVPSDAPASTADRKMYEDIEILRRILGRKLHTLYPPTFRSATIEPNRYFGVLPNATRNEMPSIPNMGGGMGMSGMPRMGMDGTSNWLYSYPVHTQEVSYHLEGVYLKGQGVVYTVTLPTLHRTAKVETAKPISEWESARREFHKEKETPKKPDEVGLREVLLKVLAENGHHFSRLGENESLTIVVTVHEESHPRPPRKSEEKAAKPRPDVAIVRDEAIRALSAISSKARDLEVLGDLHLKQGRYEDAITAFQKAVESASSSKEKAALHRKLAQAYLMQEKIEEARSHVDRAIAFLKEAQDAKNKPASAAKSETTPLPVKVIISVSKKLLDQAGEGKMTFEEFCRRANVETLRFEGAKR